MPFVKVLQGCSASGKRITEGETTEVSESDYIILKRDGRVEDAAKPKAKAKAKKAPKVVEPASDDAA